MTIAAQHGLVNQEDFFNKTKVAKIPKWVLSLQKDFTIIKLFGDYTWGGLKRLERWKIKAYYPLCISVFDLI